MGGPLLTSDANQPDDGTFLALSSGGDWKATPAKRRRRTSPQALAVLEEAFSENSLPSKDVRNSLSDAIGWDPRAVQVWFQNRRQRDKRDRETAAYYADRVEHSESKRQSVHQVAAACAPPPAPPPVGPIRVAPTASRASARHHPYAVALASSATAAGPAAALAPGEVWRLMPSSPERAADYSSSPVKASMRPAGLARAMSLDVMASRPQQVFSRAVDADSSPAPATNVSSLPPSSARSSQVPSLSYSLDASSEMGSDMDEPVYPEVKTDIHRSPVKLDEADRECANLLLQLFATSA